MTAWLRPWFVWLCIMGFGIMLHAQTAEPAPVQKALDILNTQGNTTYDFFDVYYFYSEQTISGNNLDCPTLSKNFDLVTKAYLVQFDTD